MIRATILGCGSSGGVPRLGGHWGECNPENPRNRRRRCSLLLERPGPQGTTRVLIDTGPDLVPQLLDAGVGLLDGVVWTHPHADHIHGLDDLRQIVHNRRAILPGWADRPTAAALHKRFGYAFETPPGSSYPPILELHLIGGPFTVPGKGGPIHFTPFTVDHGIPALGFRICEEEGGRALVYLPDVLAIGPDPQGVPRQLARMTPPEPVAAGDGTIAATLPIDLPPELRNRITRFAIEGEASAGAVVLADDRVRRRSRSTT